MIKIAICDDEPRELAATVAYTKEYLEAKNVAATVCEFRHPDELLIACENERFSIYILDIVMPMVNGIAVGKTIRHLDRAAAIIYVTGEAGLECQHFVGQFL